MFPAPPLPPPRASTDFLDATVGAVIILYEWSERKSTLIRSLIREKVISSVIELTPDLITEKG